MRVLYPPRPVSKITSGELAAYEVSGQWVAQRKYNGTRNLVHILPSGQVEMFNRHGEYHKQFVMSSSLRDQILSLNIQGGLEYWLDGELLDAKTITPAYKGRVVFYDVLFARQYLYGMIQMKRLEMLRALCRDPQELEPNLGLALRVTNDLWMAETFASGFNQEYERFIENPEIEGLVLRRKSAALDNIGTRPYDVPWVLRCRKPHKNYTF